MTTTQIDILKSALFAVELEELECYKTLPYELTEPSPELEEKIHKINQRRKSFFTQITKTVPRKIAVALIAAVISLCLMMSISAIRVPIVNFFVNFYEDHISIHFQTNEELPTNIEEIYMPSQMVNGYTLVDTIRHTMLVDSCWQKDDSYIFCQQDVITDNSEITLDSEFANQEKLYIDNLTVYFARDNTDSIYTWVDHGYLFTLIFMEEISIDQIKQIITSFEVTE
ncbi:MAG: hypothetical protein IJ039_09380 [Clostridia bacterium]|nr:hypothetical protein [Clostridia bacterium]